MTKIQHKAKGDSNVKRCISHIVLMCVSLCICVGSGVMIMFGVVNSKQHVYTTQCTPIGNVSNNRWSANCTYCPTITWTMHDPFGVITTESVNVTVSVGTFTTYILTYPICGNDVATPASATDVTVYLASNNLCYSVNGGFASLIAGIVLVIVGFSCFLTSVICLIHC